MNNIKIDNYYKPESKTLRLDEVDYTTTPNSDIKPLLDKLKEMLDKHDKILKDNNWIQAIIILSLFGKNMTIEELDAILTKLENGTLTKEEFLKEEVIENEFMD